MPKLIEGENMNIVGKVNDTYVIGVSRLHDQS